MTKTFWRGKRVFLTGHTGFKGGWLSLWLQSLGAEVHGYALKPPTQNNFFTAAAMEESLASHQIGDVRDGDALKKAMKAARPEIVFHLAAQPLVRYSYQDPVETYSVNVMGTVHLLEAVRASPGVKAVVNVTTDKCYENREWAWGYRESEAMGGFDPYSSSKGCAELVTSAYRRSFLESAGVALSSARAGNVIGGGDWAVDRLIPDFLRAADAGKTFEIRSPDATRPWQHVLEPLSGYMLLAERLFQDGKNYSEAWNFGPGDQDVQPVQWIAEQLSSMQPEIRWSLTKTPQPHEASCLKLDSSKAKARLGWTPRWNLRTALEKTLDWHQAWRRGETMKRVSLEQIEQYQSSGADQKHGVPV